MFERVKLFFDPLMIEHDTGPGHPEQPDRLRAIRDRLRGANHSFVDWCEPEAATRDDVERIHTSSHVDQVEALRGGSGRLDPDTVVSPRSVEAAYLAAGAAIGAVDASHSVDDSTAFALVRPPGHHAESDRAMGFCLFNNIAIAADYATAELGYSRVLVLDWDVHHGNGTHYSFYDRKDVFVFNTHRSPFYPGTGDVEEMGRSNGSGYTLNIPMPGGMGDGDYRHAFETVLEPVMEQYEPQLVLVSAGFDSHEQDPLGGMNVTSEGFGALCRRAMQIAKDHADGRIALVLEGGYDLDGLAESVEACVAALNGAPFAIDAEPSEAGQRAVGTARQYAARQWDV
jgi:acetoin utilization deacetylase AcuC-like enzyme